MSIRVDFDTSNFERQLRKWVGDTARVHTEKMGRSVQMLLDSVWETHQGHPIDEVATALRSGGVQKELHFSDGQVIMAYAEAISNGHRIHLQVDTPDFA